MKIAAVVVLLGALVFYVHERGGGSNSLPGYKTSVYEASSPETDWAAGTVDPKTGARILEELLRTRYATYPAHAQRCRPDRSRTWDYVCTDTVTGKRLGYDLDGESITAAGPLR